VAIQITDESLVPDPPLTSKGFPKMDVELETTTSNSYHSGNAQLRPYENTDNESDTGGLSPLLPSTTIYTIPSCTTSHAARQNHLLLKSLATHYNSDYTKAQKEQEDYSSEDDEGDSSLGIGSIANPESPS